MPQFLSRPVGPGDLAEWSSINVSSGGIPLANWDAVGPASSNQFVISGAPGARDRYAMAPLPADATAVVGVTLFAYCAGDDDHLMRLALRLAGVDLLSATFSPRDSTYDLFEISYPLAPGGLAWTVARWNAIQAGQDCVTASLPEHQVNELFAVVDYETASETVETEQGAQHVRIRGTASTARLAGTAEVLSVRGASSVARVAGLSPVAKVSGAARAVSVRGTPSNA